MKRLITVLMPICLYLLVLSSIDASAYNTCDPSTCSVPCTYNSVDYFDVVEGTYAGNPTNGAFFNRLYIYNASYSGGNLHFYSSVNYLQFYCNDLTCEDPAQRFLYLSSEFGVFDPHSSWDFGLGVPVDLGAPPSPGITVHIVPQSGGSVAGMPGVLSCTNGTCIGTFTGNETVTAMPATGYTFAYWKDGNNIITENPHTFTVDEFKKVSAIFYPIFPVIDCSYPEATSLIEFLAPDGNFYCSINPYRLDYYLWTGNQLRIRAGNGVLVWDGSSWVNSSYEYPVANGAFYGNTKSVLGDSSLTYYSYGYGPVDFSANYADVDTLINADTVTISNGVPAPENYNLAISRSPELGGGVTVTPPLEFPIFYCGLNGKEECDLEVNQNGQVTLRAQNYPGYAFSHWVINNQTMEDTDGEIDVWMNEDKNVVAVYYLDMRLPLTGGKNWLLSVEPGGEVECGGGIDPYHTGNSYYSFDFTDNTLEDGHLEGTDVPIRAALGGFVDFAGGDPNDNGYGYNVVIDHGNGYKTRYAHLKYEPTVSGTVLQGDQIGIMGDTGNSEGIHLHFQVYHDGNSSATNEGLLFVHLDSHALNYYQVGCRANDPPTGFYFSSN